VKTFLFIGVSGASVAGMDGGHRRPLAVRFFKNFVHEFYKN